MPEGDFNIKKFSKFLKSFWGILASFTVALPTIIYFINTQQIKDSALSEYYLAIPTTFAILTIPFIFLYESSFFDLPKTRRFATISAMLSLITLFGFLITKGVFVGNKMYSKNIDSFTVQKIEENKKGEIFIRTTSNRFGTENMVSIEERINILEIGCLVLFTFSVILITASFSGLGVFYYRRL